MKNIARSRATSFALVFAMVLTMLMGIGMVPAYAAETESLELVPVDDMNDVVITAEGNGVPIAENSQTASDIVIGDIAKPAATTEIRNYIGIEQVVLRPVVYSNEEGAAYVLNNLTRAMTWSNPPQSDSMRLSPEQVTAFVQEIFTALLNDSSTSEYTWVLIGWNVSFVFRMTAEKPLRLEWTPSALCASTTEKQTISITDTDTRVRMAYNYTLPEDFNSSYSARVSGAFYFRYSSGQEGGLMMGGGVGFNSSLPNY